MKLESNATPATATVTGSRKDRMRKRRKRNAFFRFVRRLFIALCLIGTAAAVWAFFTPSGTQFRYLVADTLITTQHRHWAKYVIGEEELKKRVEAYNHRFEEMGQEEDLHEIAPVPEVEHKELVEIKPVSGEGFKGYLMIVNDPTKIRIVVPNRVGTGEKVSSMVSRTGAIAGVNAGGFADPEWKGNGFKPIGLVIANGKIYYNGLGSKKKVQIVGIDRNGKMVAGNYTLDEMEEMGVKEAVSFSPRIIVNGKGLVKKGDGWGIAPRTVMGQREDGAMLFLIIDGRQAHSLGADLYDCQQVMLDNGAVIAANLDGGSSTVLVKDNEIVNSPASKYGERYLPTAFLVFDDPDAVDVPNIWEGLDPSKIDPGKKIKR
ncbi:phosphodiester glycosidase family protein [Paenibacillus sp. MSJ-34]|uniref:phosphodiester glycosidase family protein n=1 Tax=Paenibacillus sp. MSJ-34 TaxID=2841529 RepID=UPI001C11D06F|nr:phosphodiester glycosidase family protein [Paenibacillus sp. MSJ-34]MBU5443691.1 phosphodiester glycosidase family protein [Paenibacillus sp. MSJ-34]